MTQIYILKVQLFKVCVYGDFEKKIEFFSQFLCLFHLRMQIAVDDIEDGKSAHEELCLLPDEEEREISDAGRERAMQDQQQVADENEQESDGIDLNLEKKKAVKKSKKKKIEKKKAVKKSKKVKVEKKKKSPVEKLPNAKTGSIKCDKCSKTYLNAWNMKRHISQEHGYRLNGKQVVDRWVCPVSSCKQMPMLSKFNFDNHARRFHTKLNLVPIVRPFEI